MELRLQSPRLQAAAEWVRPGSCVADIGTDHALLPVALVKSGRCPSAIASDLRAGPLDAARHAVAQSGLASRISLRLGNGLKTVFPGEAEDIVIAGMGGETIAAILGEAGWVKDPCYRLILQPMTRAEELHAFLWDNGFELERECTVEEGRHDYLVMQAAYSGQPHAFREADTYLGILDPAENLPYFTKIAARLQKQAEGVRRGGLNELADRQQKLADELSARMKREESL